MPSETLSRENLEIILSRAVYPPDNGRYLLQRFIVYPLSNSTLSSLSPCGTLTVLLKVILYQIVTVHLITADTSRIATYVVTIILEVSI